MTAWLVAAWSLLEAGPLDPRNLSGRGARPTPVCPQVRQLALSAVDHAFLPEEERAELKRRMRAKMGMQDSACEEAVQAAAAAAIGVVSKAAAGGRPAPAAAPAAANGRPAAPAAAPAAAAPAAAAPAADGKAAEPRSRWRLRWPMKGLRVASS